MIQLRDPRTLAITATRTLEFIALATLAGTRELDSQWLMLITALALAGYLFRERQLFSRTFIVVAMGVVVLGSVVLWPRLRLHPVVAAAHSAPLLHSLLWFSPRTQGQFHLRLTLAFLEISLASAITPELFVAGGIFLFFVTASMQLTALHLWNDFAKFCQIEVRHRIPRSVLLFGAATSLLVMAASLMIFPFLPRFQSPWSSGAGRRDLRNEMGYSEQVDLGSGLSWLRDGTGTGNVPVLRIFLEERDWALERLRFPLDLLKMRILSRWDGTKWVAGQELEPIPGPGPRSISLPPGTLASLQAIREPLPTDSLPVPYSAVGAAVHLASGETELTAQGQGLLRRPGLSDRRVSYELRMTALGPPAGGFQLAPPTAEDLWLPESKGSLIEDLGRWRQLSNQIFAGAKETESARLRLQRLSNFLRSNGFEPGLVDFKPGSGAPALDRFVFEWRKGHCEWFSTASLLLLRLQGIPARLVSGFRISSPPFAGVLTVRQKDAHLWLEAWDASAKAWVAFDPTPRIPVLSHWTERSVELLRETLNWASSHWYRWVLKPAETPESLLERTWLPFRSGFPTWKSLNNPSQGWQKLARRLGAPFQRLYPSILQTTPALLAFLLLMCVGLWAATRSLTTALRALHWSRKSPALAIRRLKHRTMLAFLGTRGDRQKEEAIQGLFLKLRFSKLSPGLPGFEKEFSRALVLLDDLLAEQRKMIRARRFFHLLAIAPLAADPSAVLDLPYGTRTKPYSVYSGTTRGDIRTVGMAGATLGLGDTFAAAGDNPAGLAMTMNVGDTHASSNQIRDGRLQSIDAPIQANSAGAALQLSHWGFSLGAINTWGEGQFYRVPVGGGGYSAPRFADIYVREYRASIAHRFDSIPISVGAQLRFGALRQSLGTDSNEFNNPAVTDTELGFTLGAMLRLPRRFILGAAVSSAMNYEPSTDPGSFADFPGMIQPANSPLTGGLGLGFIPNRIFRADFSLKFVGSTPGAALLSDESKLIAGGTTWEPRLGAAYVFGDFRSMRATGFAGTYLEPSRIRDVGSRIHTTGGVELKWSFVNFGLGFDVAPDYRNLLASVGIDPFAVMERLGIIPSLPPESRKGFLPGALYFSDEGLPASLQDKKSASAQNPGVPGLDPIQIGIDIPKKIGEKVRNFNPGDVIDTLKELPSDISDDINEVSQEIDKKLRPFPRRRKR